MCACDCQAQSELITRPEADWKTHTHNVLQVAPIIGITDLSLTHSFTHSCHSRFLPRFAGMAILAMVVAPNSLSKMCLSDSGNLMLSKVQLAKALLPMRVTDSPKVMLAKDLQFAKALLPMCVTDSPKVMLFKELQYWKAPLPMCVTDSPKVMLSKHMQFAKALLPMCVTDSPKVMLSKELQYWKASSPMCVTDSPKVMLSKHMQFAKALLPMCVTDSPKVMLFKELQYWKAPLPMCVTDSPKVMLSKHMQFAKALLPMCVTDSPKVMLSKELQYWKASSPMCVTDSPKVMLSKDLQCAKALIPMCVTESLKAMLSKEVQHRKASSPMCFTDSPKVIFSKEVQHSKAESPIVLTDSGIVSRTSCCELLKAFLEMFVTLEGIVTPKLPRVWMSCFVAASTSFAVYATLSWDSALKNPPELSVSVSSMSMIAVLRTSSTWRTLRLLGSWQGCFSRSIAFNSRTVAVMGRSRVMTPPCKVFTLTSQDMAAKEPLIDLAPSTIVVVRVRGWPKKQQHASLIIPVLLWVFISHEQQGLKGGDVVEGRSIPVISNYPC